MVTTRSSPRKKPPSKKKTPVKKTNKPSTPKNSRKKASTKVNKAPASVNKAPTSDSKKRPKNFTEEEDVLICRAFVNISENPIIGNDQKSADFWSAVQKKYRELVVEELEEGFHIRDADAIRNRFGRHIQKDVYVFNGHYKTCKENKQSGYVEDNYFHDALELYLEMEGKPFRFAKCVDILHQMPKFNPMTKNDKANNLLEDTTSDDDSAQMNQPSEPMGSKLPRPIGSKAAKKLVKDEKQKEHQTQKKEMMVDRMANASERLAKAIEDKSKRDSALKMASIYASLGDTTRAKELLDELTREDEAVKEAKDLENLGNLIGEELPDHAEGIAIAEGNDNAIANADVTGNAIAPDAGEVPVAIANADVARANADGNGNANDDTSTSTDED